MQNTSFDKEEILASQKSFMSSMNIPINEEYDDLHTFLYFILDSKTSLEYLYRLPVLRSSEGLQL